MLFIFSFQYRTRNNRFASLFGVCQIRQHPLIFFFFVFHTKKPRIFTPSLALYKVNNRVIFYIVSSPCFPHHFANTYNITPPTLSTIPYLCSPPHTLYTSTFTFTSTSTLLGSLFLHTLHTRSLLLYFHAPYFSTFPLDILSIPYTFHPLQSSMCASQYTLLYSYSLHPLRILHLYLPTIFIPTRHRFLKKQ